MPVDYELRVRSPDGASELFRTRSFLETGPSPGLAYVLNAGNIGALTVTLPPELNSLLPKDARIGVWRSVNGAPAQLEGGSVYLIRKWDYADNFTVVTGVHANHIMTGRCSLYATSTAASLVTSDIDSDLKDTWRVNFTADATASGLRASTTGSSPGDGTYVDISAYVSRQANLGGTFPTIKKLFSWRNIHDVFLELCEASYQAGTYAVVEIVAPTESTLEFQAFYGQRGVDRRFSTGSNLIFTAARGNLENALLTIDAINEVTFAQAGGQGISTGVRYVATAIDTARAGETPFGRREIFIDDSNNTSVASLTDMAQSAVQSGIPVITATGDLTETDTCIRGVHYDFGDYVTVVVQGQQYDMRLDVLEVQVHSGQEDTTGDSLSQSPDSFATRIQRDSTRGHFVHTGTT